VTTHVAELPPARCVPNSFIFESIKLLWVGDLGDQFQQ
jgi:hypothetical protein